MSEWMRERTGVLQYYDEIIIFCQLVSIAFWHGRWLFLNSTDPANELSWLVSVLQQAETNSEKVMTLIEIFHVVAIPNQRHSSPSAI